MCTYPIQQHKHKNKGYLAKMPGITCVHTLYNNTNINTKFVYKMTSIACVHTLYINKNIKKRNRFQKDQYYTCTYPLQQRKHKHKGSLPNP